MRVMFPMLLVACQLEKFTAPDHADDILTSSSDVDADGYDADEDCDDNNAAINPGEVELCDGVDNDCDGEIDEDVLNRYYEDGDGDGYGNSDVSQESCQLLPGFVPIGNDCDDTRDDVYPGMNELCDGLDNDCDGEIDEDLLEVWYADGDGDGFGDPDSPIETCSPENGYVEDDTDCDDTTADANPNMVEVCDEVDNDCDGETDEGVTTTYYEDFDSDDHGISDATTESCDRPTGYAALSGDCDDRDEDINPDADEVCDEVDNDCDGTIDESDALDASSWYADADADGYGDASSITRACEEPSGHVSDDSDCDDGDGDVNPGESELCNAVDDDCDGTIDEADAADASTWYADADADGYGDGGSTTAACDQPSGFVDRSGDCNDGDADVNPGESEVCNEVDDDCDGTIDEDDAADASTWYVDADVDGYGDVGSTTAACEQPAGYVSDDTDCDDGDGSVNPGESELCNAVDDDCDGTVDEDGALDASTWYADTDADGYGDASSTTAACDQPAGYAGLPGDCNDADAAVNPGESEVCNAVDDDCDGTIDEADAADASTWYADSDVDGYGDVSSSTAACDQPSGYVSDDTDCDDGNGRVNPGESELCNAVDDDCDGDIDEDDALDASTWFADTDADGYGDPDRTASACEEPSGFVSDRTDCDDDDDETHPGALDACDGVDNDCDGDVDEAATDDAWLASFFQGAFYEIDPDDGSYTELPEPDSSSIDDLGNTPSLASSIHGSGGIAYAYDGTNDRLLMLDVCEEELTEVGESGINSSCGMAIGPDGELYGINSNTDTLVVFDRSDGSASEVGSLGLEVMNCALTYDCATDTLVGMHIEPDDGVGVLFSIDASTGAMTEEVELDTSVSWVSAGLQYDPPSGMFLAATEDGIYEVDMSDGSAAKVVDLGVNNLTYVVDECD